MARAGIRARTIALLPLGAYAVHQLRYLALPAGEDPHAHSYLGAAPVVLAVLAALVLARHLQHSAAARGPVSAPRAVAPIAAALLAIYVGQELIEAIAVPGAPLPFAHGGWIAAPLALAVGALLSLALRAGDAAHAALAAEVALAPRLPLPPLALLAAGAPLARPGRPLARHCAGRGPPARS
jgi:hypothetical protein